MKGEIIIHKIPETEIPNNTEELRKLWLGCRIKGAVKNFRYPAYRSFEAYMDACYAALRAKHSNNADEYIAFLRAFISDCEEKRKGTIGYDLACSYSLNFKVECFYFIPKFELLNSFQKMLWLFLEKMGAKYGFCGI